MAIAVDRAWVPESFDDLKERFPHIPLGLIDQCWLRVQRWKTLQEHRALGFTPEESRLSLKVSLATVCDFRRMERPPIPAEWFADPVPVGVVRQKPSGNVYRYFSAGIQCSHCGGQGCIRDDEGVQCIMCGRARSDEAGP